MVILDGNIEVVAGSTDPVTPQIFKKNGVDPEPIPGITGLTLWLRSKKDNSIQSFTSGLTVIDEDLGKIQFVPAVDSFVNSDAGIYYYHLSFSDNTGTKIKVPVDTKQYTFTVFRNHES